MGHHDAFAEAVIAIVPVEPRARRSDCDPPTDTAYALRARMLDCESASLLPASTSAQTGDGAVRPWGASHIMLGTSSPTRPTAPTPLLGTSAQICPFARRVLPRDADSISNSLRNFQLVPERVRMA